MADWILAGILLSIVGAAVLHIRKAGKKGKKCMGCPSAGCCSGGCRAAEGRKEND